MRFRRERRERVDTVAVHSAGRWVPLSEVLDPERATSVIGTDVGDLVGILAGGTAVRERIEELCAAAAVDFSAGIPLLPLRPAALRCFSEWEAHWVQAAHGLAARYHPLGRNAARFIAAYEATTRTTFPPLRPGKEFFQHPTYYQGNHLNVIADAATVEWPSYCRDLDYELEIGAIVVRPIKDAGPEEALAAIGGFLVLNDLSARDTQWKEHSDGQFGPVIKTKGFATAIGAEVVSADEVLPWIDDLGGTVTVNGAEWASTSTAGMQHGIAAMASWASTGEQVHPGELLATGTLPSGSGLELDRWVQAGDVVRLEIERIGSVTSTIGARPGVGTGR